MPSLFCRTSTPRLVVPPLLVPFFRSFQPNFRLFVVLFFPHNASIKYRFIFIGPQSSSRGIHSAVIWEPSPFRTRSFSPGIHRWGSRVWTWLLPSYQRVLSSHQSTLSSITPIGFLCVVFHSPRDLVSITEPCVPFEVHWVEWIEFLSWK